MKFKMIIVVLTAFAMMVSGVYGINHRMVTQNDLVMEKLTIAENAKTLSL